MENIENTNNFKFYCEKCDYGCEYKVYYERHMNSGKHINGKITKIHKIKKPELSYICDKCEFISNHIYNFKTHILNNHSTIEERKKEFTYYCECCDYGIFSKDNFDKHLLTKRHFMKSK
jgi:hypothetical protein